MAAWAASGRRKPAQKQDVAGPSQRPRQPVHRRVPSIQEEPAPSQEKPDPFHEVDAPRSGAPASLRGFWSALQEIPASMDRRYGRVTGIRSSMNGGHAAVKLLRSHITAFPRPIASFGRAVGLFHARGQAVWETFPAQPSALNEAADRLEADLPALELHRGPFDRSRRGDPLTRTCKINIDSGFLRRPRNQGR